MEKYGYIYLTTNLINNKIYVGQRKSDKFIKAYYGSGVYFKKALKKYGKENFKVELITWSNNKEQSNMFEIFWIKTFDATNPEIGYNLCNGGRGTSGYKLSDETKNKLSEINSGDKHPKYGTHHSEETRKKISESNKGQKLSEEQKKKLSESHKGYIMPQEQKNNISKAHKGKIKTEEHLKNWSESRKGHLTSEYQKMKVSESNKTRIISDETKKKKSESMKKMWLLKKQK